MYIRFNDLVEVCAGEGVSKNQWLQENDVAMTHIHLATRILGKGLDTKRDREKYLISKKVKPANRKKIYDLLVKNTDKKSLYSHRRDRRLLCVVKAENEYVIAPVTYGTVCSHSIKKHIKERMSELGKNWRKEFRFISSRKVVSNPEDRLNSKWWCFFLEAGIKIGQDGLNVKRHSKDEFECALHSTYKKAGYGGYTRWHYTYKQVFFVPKTWYLKDMITADGIVSHIEKKHKVGDYTIYQVKNLIKKTREYMYEAKDGVLAEFIDLDGLKTYYHSTDVTKAIRGIKRKITIAARGTVKQRSITLDTKMTMNKYMKITGACKAGCLQFCSEHDLEPDVKMPLSELLPMLEADKAYGLDKIHRLLNKTKAVM